MLGMGMGKRGCGWGLELCGGMEWNGCGDLRMWWARENNSLRGFILVGRGFGGCG